jgi:hypothetical protein
MRKLTLLALLALTACAADPRALGITGPGTAKPPEPQTGGADSAPVPGAPATGTFYGPTNGPTRGASGFWGYN